MYVNVQAIKFECIKLILFYVWALLHDEGQVDHIHDCCLLHNKPWPQWLTMGKDHRDFFSKKTENWMYMLSTEKGSLFILDIFWVLEIFPSYCGMLSRVGHPRVLDHWPSIVSKASTCGHPSCWTHHRWNIFIKS